MKCKLIRIVRNMNCSDNRGLIVVVFMEKNCLNKLTHFKSALQINVLIKIEKFICCIWSFSFYYCEIFFYIKFRFQKCLIL